MIKTLHLKDNGVRFSEQPSDQAPFSWCAMAGILAEDYMMTTDELIAALRKDAVGSSMEHRAAQLEIDRLEAARKAASLPDAEIRAGLRGLREKFEGLWKNRHSF